MKIFRTIDPRNLKIIKITGIIILAIIVMFTALRLLTGAFLGHYSMNNLIKTAPSAIMPASGWDYSADEAMQGNTNQKFGKTESLPGLSARNVAGSTVIDPVLPSIYPPSGTTGDDAEKFEVTDYNVSIETRRLDQICAAISDLKARDYVIFENTNQYKHGCNYTFKVKKANVLEILDIIKKLKPKDLSENVYTIKALVDDYTSETEILQKKLSVIDDTLKKAGAAYDEITSLATRIEDAESLAKIITSKINIIERLTQEKLNVSAQLERLSRSKADQMDRLEYTYFHVNVYENKFIDGTAMMDSWKNAIKDFVRQLNGTVQSVSIGLVVFILNVIQYVVYLLILVLVARYGWRIVKRIWKGPKEII